MEDNKTELGERFARLFKGCRLHAIHLDGFSHDVFFKDADGVRHIETFSAYCSPCEAEEAHVCEDGAIRSFNADRVKALFLGYGHISYQHNAKEYVYAPVSAW